MSHGVKCRCQEKAEQKMENWTITTYRGNYSAFSGYKFTPSDYSQIRCNKCNATWRTKANYVYSLKMKELKQQNNENA